ncbi:MAG: hypothetical protein JRJ44_00455 [Deltaproteobacteria bacterium]|nr:hypothetical protein [Deltaproteobacteria bacterium]
MSLLKEIQNDAIDSNIDLAVLLRKCKVFAVRLGSPEFKQWVGNELSGYADIESLPNYQRSFNALTIILPCYFKLFNVVRQFLFFGFKPTFYFFYVFCRR